MGKTSFAKIANRLFFGPRNDAHYRFLVRNWSGHSDLNLIANVLATETFRSELRPTPLTLDGVSSLMILAPHQDDELIGAGGLLVAAQKANIQLHLAFLTNGAQTGLVIDGETLEPLEAARLREREARVVCERLGANYIEIGIDNIAMDVTSDHVAKLRQNIEIAAPDIILAPWLFDGSPKHRVANQLLAHALSDDTEFVREVWGYQVNNTPFANTFFDVSDFMKEKLELLAVYQSQINGLRPYDHLVRGLNAWNSRFLPSKSQKSESFAEIYFAVPAHAFCDLVDRYYTRDFDKTYLGRADLATRMSAIASGPQ